MNSRIGLALLLVLNVNYASAQHAGHAGVTMLPECHDKAGQAIAPVMRCSQVMSAVFDQTGRLWLVWVNSQYIYVNFSDDKGKTYSAPVRVNQTPEAVVAQGENRPKIVLDGNGRIFLSWTVSLPKPFSGHVRFSRSLDGGRHFSEPITVNDHLEMTSHRFEAIAVNPRGDIFVVWLDKRDKLLAEAKQEAYPGAALYFTISTDHGQSFKKNLKLADHSCECCRTALAIDNDQLPVVLWRHIFPVSERDHALMKLEPNYLPGTLVRASHDRWKIEGCPHHGPSISIAKNGTYHLAWFTNADRQHGLFYARADEQGKQISKPLAFGSYESQASHPQVLSRDDQVYLAWIEFDGKLHSLLAMASHDGGRQWSEPMRIAQSEQAADYPLLLADKATVYLAWHIPREPYRLFPLTLQEQ